MADLKTIRDRHENYRAAVLRLAQSGTTVAERKALLCIRDEFERDVRSGLLDVVFDQLKAWI